MRLAIPQDMRAAQEVIERKDAILNQAQVDARRVRREAEDEFATRLDQNELMAAARKRAEELDQDIERKATRLMEQAVSESRNSRADADAYVVQTMRKLENEMTSVLASVRKGLDALSLEVPV